MPNLIVSFTFRGKPASVRISLTKALLLLLLFTFIYGIYSGYRSPKPDLGGDPAPTAVALVPQDIAEVTP